ncbi:hypothetical protein Tco_1580390 [Tanacetum coccineum]
MDAYRDKDMGDVIIGKPFCRVACIEAKRFDGFITVHDGNDSVTYQMARSYPRFKHIFNEQCNKIWPLLQVSARDILEGNSHSYQKLKGFFKGILNLGPEYIQNEKMVEWLTRGHVSIRRIHHHGYGIDCPVQIQMLIRNTTHIVAHKLIIEDHTEQISGEFSF